MIADAVLRRFLARVPQDIGDGCAIWLGGRARTGYGVFALDHRHQALAHRLAYEHFLGPIPDGMSVLHRCDNPPCVRPDHLFLGTQSENILDMYTKGRAGVQRRPELLVRARQALHAPGGNQVKGERHPDAKLSEAQVLEIRHRGAPTYSDQLAMAREFGVTDRNIRSIIKRETWRHI